MAARGPYRETARGSFYNGLVEEVLAGELGESLSGSVQLLLRLPPFPLSTKKSYGNHEGSEYRKWFSDLARLLADLLTEDGSVVIELGNAWEPGRPVQLLPPMQCIISFGAPC